MAWYSLVLAVLVGQAAGGRQAEVRKPDEAISTILLLETLQLPGAWTSQMNMGHPIL